MGEYDFILYSFQGGSLHEEYDVLADMSYLPKVEFKEVKLSKTKEGKSYKKFLERGLFKKETDAGIFWKLAERWRMGLGFF